MYDVDAPKTNSSYDSTRQNLVLLVTSIPRGVQYLEGWSDIFPVQGLVKVRNYNNCKSYFPLHLIIFLKYNIKASEEESYQKLREGFLRSRKRKLQNQDCETLLRTNLNSLIKWADKTRHMSTAVVYIADDSTETAIHSPGINSYFKY